MGAGKAAQVTAGNLIFLVAHGDGFHDEEAIPREPEGVLLGDERCTLEAQDDGNASVGDQVKAVWGQVEKEWVRKTGNGSRKRREHRMTL